MATKSFLSNIDVQGSGAFSSSVTALSIIKSGGTSTQFLMADGSVSSGGGAAGATFTHNQAVASLTWTVTHNLGVLLPSVTVYDATNSVIIPKTISAVNVNSMTITFYSVIAGNAVMVVGGAGIQGIQGIQGVAGNGIASIVRTTGNGAAGTTDTYTITYTNATTTTFNVYNGANGTGDMNKSVYDTNNNGIVDNSALVNGLSVLTAVPAGALFTDTVYTLPFADNSANWNSAYSWGNHAGLYQAPITAGTTAQYWRGDKTWQTLPTSLPASDVYAWAKAATKPTYTYTEVGAQVAGSYPTGSGTVSGSNTGDNAVNTLYSGLISNATHTGEVTGSTLLTITDGAVTLAKMANMATGSLIYRKTAGTGAPEVQTLATLKTDLGLTGTNSGDQTSGNISIDDHATTPSTTTKIVGIVYGTSATPPTANTTPIGTLYIQYTA
jgi:hypothetical protein